MPADRQGQQSHHRHREQLLRQLNRRGVVQRKLNDQLAGGLVLEGTRDITITGNTFSSLPKAVELRAPKSENILFSNNLLIDSPTDPLP